MDCKKNRGVQKGGNNMTIGGVNGNATIGNSPVHMSQSVDSYSKSLQNQIANAQKQLQELSKNNDLDPETKMKKRQEIQKQISDLNNQLRQHQMELRRKEQQEKQQSEKSVQKKEPSKKTDEETAGMSQTNMTSILSAESSISQARVQSSVSRQAQYQANIKKTELKLDRGKGNAEKKRQEIAELEEKSQEAAVGQMSSLADANQTVKEATKTQNKDTSVDKLDKDAKKEEHVDHTQDIDNEHEDVKEASSSDSKTNDTESDQTTQTPFYTRIDVRI